MVVSELRKPRPHGAVAAWISAQSDRALYVSAVTLGEIQAGLELTRDNDPTKAVEIEAWLDLVTGRFNVLPVTGRDFRAWARLLHHQDRRLSEDALIAACAANNGLTLVTRNTRDFVGMGVTLLNPWGPEVTASSVGGD
ncbi:MAG: type II toxin-antitoxin system VapC family toxin [Bifidobacteriaceae bacterium]|jgi:predicted nucleic acid-binding protein|nr:type II toxin-antitoxin system VapC family toxin [Bifidobacteriaceae bacterium]